MFFSVFCCLSIALCITVFGVLGAWGGIGLELHVPNKLKTVRPAWGGAPNPKIKRAGKSNEKTHQMVRS